MLLIGGYPCHLNIQGCWVANLGGSRTFGHGTKLEDSWHEGFPNLSTRHFNQPFFVVELGEHDQMG